MGVSVLSSQESSRAGAGFLCAFVIYYFLSSLPADSSLFLRSYLLAPQLPTFHLSSSMPFFPPLVLTILSLKLPN